MSNNNMLSVSQGFQYSINIKYDVDNSNKISSYIPTEKSIELFNQLIASLDDNSTDRARLVIGPYGTGKSHLLAIFSAIIRKKLPNEIFAPILEKISSSGEEATVKNTRNIINTKKPYLTVFINGNHHNLQQNFTQNLVKAIKEEQLNIKPHTAYIEIEKILNKWKNHFHSTYDTFKYYLSQNYQLDITQFLNLVANCDPEAYNIFTDLYPTLTAGSQFNPFHIESIAELYEDVAQKIKSKGYSGIYVIFDEFNKHLETAVKNKEFIDLKPLQDFAEMCSRSESNQVHLTLISHQHISQYANRMSHDLMNEWRKVEGRFNTFELQHQSSKIYTLISNVIIKQPELWSNFLCHHNKEFHELKKKIAFLGIFKELTEEQLEKWIIKGCYPLHPITTYCLPRMSNKVAQNERSIFTFLSTNNFYTLGKFLENHNQNHFGLVTIDYLFNYFADLMKKQHHEDIMYKTWVKVNEAINKLPDRNTLAEKILKALGLITGLREEQTLPPTKRIVKCALSVNQKDENNIEDALTQLANAKIVYIRKSDEKIQFFSGSDQDFGLEIDRVKSNQKFQAMFNLSYILNEHFTPYPIIANRYNDKFEMTRYFLPVFYTASELIKGIDWDKELLSRGYVDGLVALIIPENEEELLEAEELIANTKHKQIIFVLPSAPLEIKGEIFDYQALDILKKDQQFLSKGPLVEVELNAYLEDYYDQIEEELNKYLNPQLKQANYFSARKLLNINNNAQLSQKVSSICEEVFYATPKINNEMINKTNITPTISKAREKVNQKIISNSKEENLGLQGYGPDMSIFRSMIKSTGLYHYDQENSQAILLRDTTQRELRSILDEVITWLQKTINNSKPFFELYDKLRRPPYGVRLGIIPILLAISLKEFKDTLIIKDHQGIEVPLSAELIESIAKKPHNYFVEIEKWELVKETYINELSKLFDEQSFARQEETANKIYPVAFAMKNWFISLPKYSRETTELGDNALSLQRALHTPVQNSKQLLFERIPQAYSFSIKQINSKEEVKKLLSKIECGKQELDNFISRKLNELNQNTLKIFTNTKNNNCYEAIVAWYQDFDTTTQNHLFDDISERFLELLCKNELTPTQFIQKAAFIISGLNIEDWSDKTYQQFIEQVKNIKHKVETFDKKASNTNNLVKIQLPGKNGATKEVSFEPAEISVLGGSLYNYLESQIDAFAESISTNEKRQILIQLLEKLT